MTRSRTDDIISRPTSSSGSGRAKSFRPSAPLTASTGPRLDQLNMATKWAAKKARTI
ncbi:hypothetical protein D3C80_2100920 [compost metagenome]